MSVKRTDFQVSKTHDLIARKAFEQIKRALFNVYEKLDEVESDLATTDTGISTLTTGLTFVTTGVSGRTLVAGANVTFVDTGAGGTLTISTTRDPEDTDAFAFFMG